MIILKVHNGLGNQMFIYGFGTYLMKKFPEIEIKYDVSELPMVVADRKIYEINDIFESEFVFLNDMEVRKYLRKLFYNHKQRRVPDNIWTKLFNVLNIYIERVFPKKEIIEPEYWNISDDFVDSILNMEFDSRRTYILNGFWENMRYLDPVKNELRRTFEFKCIVKKIKGNYGALWDKQTVGIHVRRGDYIKESESEILPKTYYTICNDDYYEKAMEIINLKVVNPVFVFFSDDEEYVETQYGFLENKVIISGNKDYEDLFLMTQCKHFIMANSTFSFWGCYLKETEGVVIAPKYHYIRMEENDNIEKEFFYNSDWIYIDNLESYRGT